MGNLNAKGAAWLAQKQRQYASDSVTYQFGATTLPVPAVRGKSEFTSIDGGSGGVVDVSADDWLIFVNDLVVNGVPVKPAEGNVITATVDGVTTKYQVMAVPGGKCWQYSDPQHIRYRIHCRDMGA